MKHLCYMILMCTVFSFSASLNGMMAQEKLESFSTEKKLDILRTQNPLLFAQLCVFLRLTDRADCLQFMGKLVQYGLDPNDQDLGSVMDVHLVGEGLDVRFELLAKPEDEPGSLPEG